MKFLFIVQGEGRGHFTQAITLEEMLIKNGHEVVEVLVGKSSSRSLPGFFNRGIKAPVKRFISPNFLPTAQNKRVSLSKSIAYNLLHLSDYINSMLYIKQRIQESGADVVINFYELLTGLTYTFLRPRVPYVCIGHQYLFLHKDFEFPKKSELSLAMLRLFTRLTSIGASKKLALSFRPMSDNDDITVVPPLLRREVMSLDPENRDYIHGYMVNAGYADQIAEYNKQHPEVAMHFFWDKPDMPEEMKVSETLSFHTLSDVDFLKYMSGCKAYASTAGFESVCEAMYLGKPVMMIPVHIEQDCNAYDAARSGAGIISDSFNLDDLIKLSESYVPNRSFVYWANSCERMLISKLEEKTDQHTFFAIPALSNYF
jgi:uncharacterized protein (TIGR00661 family)